MKKLLLILLILALPVSVSAGPLNPYMAGIATSVDDCAWIGSAAVGWNGEHSDDNKNLCVSGGVVEGTLSVATIEAAPSQPPSGGTVSLKSLDKNEYLEWPVTAGDIINTSEGSVILYVYPDTSGDPTTLFETYKNGNNLLYLLYQADNTIRFIHNGNINEVIVTSTDTVTDDAWNKVQVEWSVTGNIIRVKVNDGDWKNDEDATTVTAFGIAADVLDLSEKNTQGVGSASFIDDFRLWKSYNQSD